MKYATIRVWNSLGNDTEVCIVYSEAELIERCAFYRAQGYAPGKKFNGYTIS